MVDELMHRAAPAVSNAAPGAGSYIRHVQYAESIDTRRRIATDYWDHAD